jgi:hypothetical protein
MHLYDTYTYAPIAMKNVYQMTNAPYIDTSVQNPLTAFSFNKNNRILRFKCNLFCWLSFAFILIKLKLFSLHIAGYAT